MFPDATQRLISARQVAVEVDMDDPKDPQRGGWVPVGADGRYRLFGVPDNRFVKIAAVDTTGTGLTVPFLLCGTNTITHGDTTLDVPLFLPGAAVPTPTLSGRVFVVMEGKPMPLAGVGVYYQSRAFGPDVVGYTDREGRYSLCGIPSMPGRLYIFCSNDVTAYDRVVDIRADTVLDIDATSFHTCLVQGAARWGDSLERVRVPIGSGM